MEEEKKNEHSGKKTILIIGISSFVGSNLAQFLKHDYKVVGTYNKNQIQIPGILTFPCDVLEKEQVQVAIFTTKPDIVIYAVGVSSVTECANRQELAEALNTSGLFNVVEYCQRYKAQICYLSSNYIFSGENKNYMEMDIPDANTILGKTQAQAEFYVQKSSLNYVIFRCCRLYGRNYNIKKRNWFESLQMKIMNNEKYNCDDYVEMGFMDVVYLGMILKISFERKVQNRLLQVSSPDILTHYEFAKKYCEIFQESPDCVSKSKWQMPMQVSSASEPVGEKLFYKMDISNIEGFLNVEIPSVEESIKFTFKRLNGVNKSGKIDNAGDGVKFI